MRRTFHITHKKHVGITIDTDITKYETLEAIILAIFRHYRDKKPDKLDELMKLLNATYQGWGIIKEYEKKKKGRG